MAEAQSVSIFEPALKRLWHVGRIVDTTMRNNAFLAMVPKREDFYGDGTWQVTVHYANPAGRGSAFARAQANTFAGRKVKFLVPRQSDHQVIELENEVIEASANDKGALVRALDDETKAAMRNLSNSAAIDLFGNGGGARGVMSGAPTVPGSGNPDYITLATKRDTRNFERGQTLIASSTDGSTAGTISTTPTNAQITGLDRSLGRLYFAAGTFTGTNWADGDFLFVDGDLDTSTTLGTKMLGLAAWIPTTAPSSSDSFLGVNRSSDAERLAGSRLPAAGLSTHDAIQTICGQMADVGAMPDRIFMSPTRWTTLSLELGASKQLDVVRGSGDAARIGFPAITVATDGGMLKVVADRNCPENQSYVCTMDTWMLRTLGKIPKIGGGDGLNKLRSATADAVELRALYRGNLGCHAPWGNGVIDFSS